MVHSYLRFEPDSTRGVVVSPAANAVLLDARIAVAAAVAAINVWNLKTGELVRDMVVVNTPFSSGNKHSRHICLCRRLD